MNNDFLGLQSTETEWYNVLTANLTDQQNRSLMEISVLADQRRAARESKKIEQQGGTLFVASNRILTNRQ